MLVSQRHRGRDKIGDQADRDTEIDINVDQSETQRQR